MQPAAQQLLNEIQNRKHVRSPTMMLLTHLRLGSQLLTVHGGKLVQAESPAISSTAKRNVALLWLKDIFLVVVITAGMLLLLFSSTAQPQQMTGCSAQTCKQISRTQPTVKCNHAAVPQRCLR